MKKTYFLLLIFLLPVTLTSCSNKIGTLVSEETVRLNNDYLKNLEIDMTSGRTTLHLYDGDPYIEYQIHKTGFVIGTPTIKIIEQNNTTQIETKHRGIVMGSVKYTIDIYLSADIVKNLEIDMTSGLFEADGLNLLSIDVEATSGKINLTNIYAEELNIDITSGALKIDGTFNNIDIEATSGSIEVKSHSAPKLMKCELTSGQATIAFPESIEGFMLNYEKTSGTIKSEFEMVNDISGRKGSAIYKEGFAKYEVSITSGKVLLKPIL